MILTRYLYNKDLVLHSLQLSIKKKDYDESLFWAYELYFSGFQKEVLDCLEEIYLRDLKENHPKLGLYINKKMAELEGKPELVATIIKNLTMKNCDLPESPKVKFVNVKEHHITGYYTKEPSDNGIPNWKLLQTVCLYGVNKMDNKIDNKMENEWGSNWLLYCLETPLWIERLGPYGRFDDEYGMFVFETEDKEEEFHDIYDYEPDEQPAEIRKRCLG
jgi:hypothetical protein